MDIEEKKVFYHNCTQSIEYLDRMLRYYRLVLEVIKDTIRAMDTEDVSDLMQQTKDILDTIGGYMHEHDVGHTLESFTKHLQENGEADTRYFLIQDPQSCPCVCLKIVFGNKDQDRIYPQTIANSLVILDTCSEREQGIEYLIRNRQSVEKSIEEVRRIRDKVERHKKMLARLIE